MNINKLALSLVTFTCITFSSAIYIAKKEITSAVLVDKAMHSIDMPTNGLYNLSVAEAFSIDKSEAAQISFLRCSFARPEFRFSWYCHQLRTDGKMTKQSYVALKADQEKYFKDNVIKSVGYEAQKWILKAEQLRLGTAINNLSKKGISNESEKNERFKEAKQIAKDVKTFNEKYKALNELANNEIQEKATWKNGEASLLNNVEHGGRELMTAGKQVIIRKIVSDSPLAIDPINEINKISISEITERFIDSESPSVIEDFGKESSANDYTYFSRIAILLFLLAFCIVCTIQEFSGENKSLRILETSKQSVKVLRKRRYKLLKTAKPFSKEAAEIGELDIKIEELDNKIAKLKGETDDR